MAVEKRTHPLLAQILEDAAAASGATEPAEQPDEEERAAAESDSLSQPEAEKQETAGADVKAPQESRESGQPPQDDVIILRRSELYRQIEELQETDPAFRNVLNSYVGRKAKQRYEPEKARLEAELLQARRQLQALQLQSMTEEEIKERAVKDPAFRRQLDEISTPLPDPGLVSAVQAAIAQTEDAVAKYIPPEVLGQYQQMLRAGYFDFEMLPNGQRRQLSVFESLERYRQVLFNAAMQSARSTGQQFVQQPPAAPPPPPASPPPQAAQQQQQAEAKTEQEAQPRAPVPNRKIAQMRPDTTPSAGRGSGLGRMSLSEFRRLSPPERLKMFPTIEEYERARAEGIIYED